MRAAFALRIFSGKYILNFGVLKSLRTFQNPFFTGGVWNELPQSLLRKASSPEGGALFVLTGRCKKLPLSGELASSKAR